MRPITQGLTMRRLALVAALLLSQPGFADTHPHTRPQKPLSLAQLTLAAEKGDASAQENLANRYEAGQGVTANPDLAAHWYHRAAIAGNYNAQLHFDQLKASGHDGDSYETEAAEPQRQAAENGDAEAQFRLALHFLMPPVSKDAIGLYWLKKAAAQSQTQAEFLEAAVLLGSLPPGQTHSRDAATAESLLQRASEQGSGLSSIFLGFTYTEGKVFPRDAAKAEQYFRKAVDQQASFGAMGLTMLYGNLSNKGESPTNAEEALRWLRVAADTPNHFNASDAEMVKLISEQATFKRNGMNFDTLFDTQPLAQFLLSGIYAKGMWGLQPDREEALRYLRLSAAGGLPAAKQLLAQVESRAAAPAEGSAP